MTIRRVNNDVTGAPTTKRGISSNRKKEGEFFKGKNKPGGFFVKGRISPGREVAQLSGTDSKMIQKTESGDKLAPVDDNNMVIATLSKGLIEHQWYHGVMPREEINDLLKVDGDFLVRKTTEKSRPFICLSVCHNNEARHFPLVYENGTWTLKNLERNDKFFELVELLNFLVVQKYQLGPTRTVLVRAIPRPEYYILHEDICLTNKLGSGAFGEVWKGTLKKRGDKDKGVQMDVAIKRIKGNPRKSMIREFVKEAKLMRRLKHQNIVQVIGVAPSEEPLMIIIELASNGCLKSFLKKTKCPTEQLMQFCRDAARGMAYLSSQMIIHRDLAARNLLLGPLMEVKISDFGLSECGKTETKATKMKVPIRWLAPESLDTLCFTTKTDVWSYAVTVWEIFSYCATDPFPGLTNAQAKDIIRNKTPPMQAPPDAPGDIVRLMLDCFEKNPMNRPTFPLILKKLSPTENIDIYLKPMQLMEEGMTDPTSGLGQFSDKLADTQPLALPPPPDIAKGAMSTRAVRGSIPSNTALNVPHISPVSLVDTQPMCSLSKPPSPAGRRNGCTSPSILPQRTNSRSQLKRNK
ncbi:unnamed protein product [Caenorhabditis angaria]|uniref:Tyrosine-protein kinase n=1 Tax=Caenorhabditis angaria TaxID=860376 RepID=A0A9P1I6I0_9PELO|nr:unnamed protein product [Caenorhabditis angaria]